MSHMLTAFLNKWRVQKGETLSHTGLQPNPGRYFIPKGNIEELYETYTET